MPGWQTVPAPTSSSFLDQRFFANQSLQYTGHVRRMAARDLPHTAIIHGPFDISGYQGLYFNLAESGKSFSKQLPQTLQRFLRYQANHGQHP